MSTLSALVVQCFLNFLKLFYILWNGFEDTMRKIVYPFLEKIGIMWMTGNINPAQEHFISNLIRQKIIVAIDGQVYNEQLPSERYVLFLPAGEMHELSLLFMSYLLKARNNRVNYLGASVPTKDLLSVVEHYQPDYVFTVITSTPPKNDLNEYLSELAKQLKSVQLLVSGQKVAEVEGELPKNVRLLAGMEEILDFVGEK